MSKAEQKHPQLNPGRKQSWPEAYRILATGALVAYSAIGSRVVAPAQAQETTTPPAQTAKATAAGRQQFEISAGPLGEVLEKLSQATQLRFDLENDGLEHLHSPGVSGLFTNRAAVEQALKGTGARFSFEGDRTVRVELEAVSELIEVVGTPVMSSPKYTEPLKDTPQTVMLISERTIQNQGATTLRDVLRNVPGLTVNAGEGGQAAGDNLTLRGFSASNDIFIDGSRDLGPQSRDPFNVEQVEVVKGPQSAMTGRGSSGGTINLSSKSPRLDPFVNLGTNFGTDGTKRGTADLDTPLSFLGERAALRMNVMGHQSGVAGRDVVKYERWGVAPTLAFGLGTPTNLTLGYSKLEQDNISDYGIPWVPNTNNVLVDYRDQPAPVPRNTFYGFRDRDHEKLGYDAATLRFKHSFSDNFSVRDQFRYGRSTRDSIATPPRFASADSTDINREMRSWITEDDIYDNQADLTASFNTGGLKHTVVSGFALTREDNLRAYRSAPNQLTTLYNPNPDDEYLGEFTINPAKGDITADTRALYAFDNVRLGRHWLANGGFRAERFHASGTRVSGTATEPLDRVDTMLSLRAGLVYNPVDSGSVYASYGSSMNPSVEGLSYGLSANNLNLSPEKTYTLETGTKWQLLRDRLLLSGALFEVRKTNARTPGALPDDPPIVLDGVQRNRGVELGATGHVTPDWMIFGGYTYMDSAVIESNNADELGHRFPNTPSGSFNLWTTYAFPGNVTIGGGANYVGKRFNNIANARSVPSYWTANLMASFPLHEKIEARVNLFNLTNAYYYDRVGGGHVIPGPARSLMGSLNFRF
ncbi:MAG: TonB-dependent siderophore receptor [Acidobacteria bacterium]|nr:TonB-dependent siderophore receptor [Acidobacteriota bacterium]